MDGGGDPNAVDVACKWTINYSSVGSLNDGTKPGDELKIGGLPPGQYTIAAWHEKHGEQSFDVSVGRKEEKIIGFYVHSPQRLNRTSRTTASSGLAGE